MNQGAAEATALFDWVEVSGEVVAAPAGDADAPPGFGRVRAAAGSPAASHVRLPGGAVMRERRPR